MIFLLTPDDIRAIRKAYQSPAPIEGANLDLIEAITGIPNLTYAWNKFGLRAEIVAKVSRL
jgi:hypothetical protein